MLGVYGKHPGFGDFIAAGVSEATRDGLSGWLDKVLPATRDLMGEGWEQAFDQASELRFWIGETVLGTALTGVMRPSRDKVGRRFPLLIWVEGTGQMPPVLDNDQTLHAALSAHLDTAQAGDGAVSLLIGFAAALPDPAPLDSDQLWAIRKDGGAADLLASVSTADHLRLARARSYWWTEAKPDRAAILHACTGMPDAQALAWMVAGVAAEAPGIEAAHGE